MQQVAKIVLHATSLIAEFVLQLMYAQIVIKIMILTLFKMYVFLVILLIVIVAPVIMFVTVV